MESKIPTAKAFIVKWCKERGYNHITQMYDIDECMKEFAELHVKTALKAASEVNETDGTEGYKIYPESILDAYPIENIK